MAGAVAGGLIHAAGLVGGYRGRHVLLVRVLVALVLLAGLAVAVTTLVQAVAGG